MRSSSARWALAPLLLVGVATLFNRSRYWIGIWPETAAAAQVSAYFISVFAAGIAGWIAATGDLRRTREQAASAAITALKIELTSFTAALLWLLASYLLVVAAAFTTTAVTLFPAGLGAFPGYTLIGAANIVCATAWGWLVGRLLAPLISALCAALSWLIVASLLTGAFPQSGPPWLEVELGAVAWRLLAVLIFAVAVCALPPRTARPARFARGLVLSGAALVAVAMTYATSTVISQRPPVAQPLCIEGEMEYCLWPEHAKYLPMVEELDRRLALLPVQLKVPERVVDYSLSGDTRYIDENAAIALAGNFDPEFDISEGSRWGLARGVAGSIAKVVFAECDPAVRDPEYRWDQLHAWLEWRLAGGGAVDYMTNAPSNLQKAWAVGHRMAAEKSESEQAVWVSTLIKEKKDMACSAE